MGVILIVIAAALIAATLVADYQWKQWMKARRQERDKDDQNG